MRTSNRSVVVGRAIAAVSFALALCVLAAPLLAQDPGAAAGAGGPPQDQPQAQSAFQIYVVGGGFIGYMIILLSIAMLALIIEFFVTLQRDKLVPPELVVELEQLISEEQYEEAMNLCDASRNYLTNSVGAALQRIGEGYDSMKEAFDNAIGEENLKLSQKVSWLNLIGNVGPMLGLFGTVWGMVQAFTQIAFKANVTPQELAAGIYTALVTTVWGLIVAIPALGFLFVFKNKVAKLSFELAGISAELIDRFKPVAQGGK